MSPAAILFWAGLVSAFLTFLAGDFVGPRTLRSALFALSLAALITTGLMGAAWVTTSS